MALFSLKNLIYIAVVVAGAAVFLLRPSNFDPVEYSLPPPPELKGPYSVNTHLRNAQTLLKGKISGPESLLVEGNTIYTGTWDAKLFKIVDGTVQKTLRLPPAAKSGKRPKECGTFDTEHLCGRPLGIRRLDAKRLIVADAYLGLFTVDFDDNKEPIKRVFSPDSKPGGVRPMFMNDLDVSSDGKAVYFSDSSAKWDRAHFLHAFLEQKPDGRLIQLDLGTGNAQVLLDKLHFPNGVQLHPDGQSVLISECSRARILRYYFRGAKKGQREVFVANMPGLPDNIRISKNWKSFLVGLAAVRHSEDLVSFLDLLGPYPVIRKFIVQIVPDRYLIPLFQMLAKKHGFVVEIDLEGKPIRSYQDPTGEAVSDVSQASDDETHLYLGSFHSDFIAKVPKKGL